MKNKKEWLKILFMFFLVLAVIITVKMAWACPYTVVDDGTDWPVLIYEDCGKELDSEEGFDIPKSTVDFKEKHDLWEEIKNGFKRFFS